MYQNEWFEKLNPLALTLTLGNVLFKKFKSDLDR